MIIMIITIIIFPHIVQDHCLSAQQSPSQEHALQQSLKGKRACSPAGVSGACSPAGASGACSLTDGWRATASRRCDTTTEATK